MTRSQSVAVVRQCDVGPLTQQRASLQRRRRDQNIKKKQIFLGFQKFKKKKEKKEREKLVDKETPLRGQKYRSRCAVLFQHNTYIITTYKYASSSLRRESKKATCTFRKSAFFSFDDDAQYADAADDAADDERVVAFSSNSRVRRAASTQKNETTFLNTPLSNGFLNVPSAARR